VHWIVPVNRLAVGELARCDEFVIFPDVLLYRHSTRCVEHDGGLAMVINGYALDLHVLRSNGAILP